MTYRLYDPFSWLIAAGIAIIASIAMTIAAQMFGLGSPCERGPCINSLHNRAKLTHGIPLQSAQILLPISGSVIDSCFVAPVVFVNDCL